jgi:hypothetical protein
MTFSWLLHRSIRMLSWIDDSQKPVGTVCGRMLMLFAAIPVIGQAVYCNSLFTAMPLLAADAHHASR